MTLIDQLFAKARVGNDAAFARWVEAVHLTVRRSLKRFARVVDVEAVVQEAFMRMWQLSRDPGWRLEGKNASLRFVLGIARNVAMEEIRRHRLEVPDLPEREPAAADPTMPDPALRKTILGCFEELPGQPKRALGARLEDGHRHPDAEIASTLGMKKNTFLQNITRARALIVTCLEGHGIRLGEVYR